jgi:hypothetical protein
LNVASPMQSTMHIYEVRPRKDRRGFDLISDALPFGRLWYDGPNAVTNATGYAMHDSRSADAVIRVYDDAGNVIETHEHKGDFQKSRVLLASLSHFPLHRITLVVHHNRRRSSFPARIGKETFQISCSKLSDGIAQGGSTRPRRGPSLSSTRHQRVTAAMLVLLCENDLR